MSCEACLTCPNSHRLFESRYMPGIHAWTTGENFRLTDWWHFRDWLAGSIGYWAHRLISPKDPKHMKPIPAPGPRPVVL